MSASAIRLTRTARKPGQRPPQVNAPLATVIFASLFAVLLTAPAFAQLTVGRTVLFNPDEGCAALQAAINSASANSLIKIGPGEIDCGTTTLSIPGLRTIEGAGRGATRIVGNRDNFVFGVVDFGTVSSSTLRGLTVLNQDGGAYSIAVTAYNSSNVRLERVHLQGGTATTESVGLFVESETSNSSVEVFDSQLMGVTYSVKTEVFLSGVPTAEMHSSQLSGPTDTSAGRHRQMRRLVRCLVHDARLRLPAPAINRRSAY